MSEGPFGKMKDGLKINKDLNNKKHGPHYDIITPLPGIGGAEQTRINEKGEVIGGTTNIGKKKVDWGS